MRLDGGRLFYILVGLELALIGIAIISCVTDLQAIGIVTQSAEDSVNRAWQGAKVTFAFWLGAKFGTGEWK